MITRIDHATREDEQQDVRRQISGGDGNAIQYHHYHGPVNVNNIREANNSNLGANYGHLNQTMHQITSPIRGGGADAGTQSIAMTADVTSLLSPILDASHTRNMKLSPPNSQCLPGTRKEVIGDIRTWADSDNLVTTPHMLWVFGYAGCGKSAVAHEIAKIFARLGRLAACFVFFRGSGDRSTAARVVTTIASQIATAIPRTEPIIDQAIRKSPGLLSTATTSLSAQFERLVYQPIIDVAWLCKAPFLIVLDGIDECQDRDEVAALIEDMIDFFDRHPSIPLRFLITSRVEGHLHQVLHSSSQVRLLNLADRTSHHDIAVALDVAIAKAKRGRLLACDESWPDYSERQRLVTHIGGSFLLMTVVIRRLFDQNSKDGLTPMERLPLILSTEANFDDLYAEFLTPWQHLPHFHAVTSAIVLAFEPLSVTQLADFLDIKTVNVVNVLINLHAIMQVPDDDHTKVTLWHTSLRDYLSAESRSGSLSAKPSHHLQLARGCISVVAASVNATESQSSKYSRSYAIEHLARAAKMMQLNTNQLADELRDIIGYLQMPIYHGNPSQTALEIVCHARHWTLVRALIDVGANVDTRFRKPLKGIVCTLHAACYHEQWELVYLLLERNANPNIVSPRKDSDRDVELFDHGTVLAFAANSKDVKLVTRLLECGADPNVQGGYFGTALRAACVQGSLEMVNLLLEHGANPNLRGGFRGGSALRECALLGYEDCARALLMHNADPNIQDAHGNTPLHNACTRGHVDVAECLVEFQADVNIRNIKGQSALQTAEQIKRGNIIQMLRRHGIIQ